MAFALGNLKKTQKICKRIIFSRDGDVLFNTIRIGQVVFCNKVSVKTHIDYANDRHQLQHTKRHTQKPFIFFLNVFVLLLLLSKVIDDIEVLGIRIYGC